MTINFGFDLQTLKNKTVQFSNSYFQLTNLIQNEVSPVKYDITSNYYKSVMYSLIKLLEEPNLQKVKISNNKIKILVNHVLLLKFTTGKFSEYFDDFSEKSNLLINQLEMFIKSSEL